MNRQNTRITLCLMATLLLAGSAWAGLKIALVDATGKEVSTSETGTLTVERVYQKGDKVVVTGAKEVAIKVDEHYAEALLYSPTSTFEFPIPLWPGGKYATKYPHPPKAFKGSKHVITARLLKPEEKTKYRNLACNPMDPLKESTMFPHASSKSEWGSAAVFSARCAIDGFVEATGDHHSWPRQSWGPYLPDSKWGPPQIAIEFGRPVEIDKLVFVLRFNKRQGGWWKEATVVFSDGSTEKIKLDYNGDRQERKIEKRTVTGFTIRDLVPNNRKKYAAFVEVEAWGREKP